MNCDNILSIEYIEYIVSIGYIYWNVTIQTLMLKQAIHI